MKYKAMQDNIIQGNLNGFEAVRKMGNDLGKSGQLLDLENGKLSGKIWTLVKLFGK